MNLRRMFAIALTEMKRTMRDRPSLSLLLLLPAFQIILFGYAVHIEPRAVPVALLGSGEQVERVAQAISGDDRLRLMVRGGNTPPEAALRQGAVVVLESQPDGSVQLTADGADPVAARAAITILQDHMLQGAAKAFPLSIPSVDLHWAFNPEQRSAWILVPGLGGAIMMISMLLLAAQSIVREREEGGWEALLLSRVSGIELLIGKTLPYVLLALMQEAVVLIVGAVLFDIPLSAGAWPLLLLVIPYAAAHLIWGLVLSLLARTRLQAMQGAMFLYLPSMLLSGFLFPFAAMPGWAQAIGKALPLTHFVAASRDLLLRGADSAAAWHALLPLSLCFGSGLIVALFLWRRQTA